MRTPTSRFERATGAFLLAVLVLLCAALLGSGRVTELFEAGRADFVLYAMSTEGFGVAVGSPVTVHDVEVGAVTKVRLVHDAAFPGKPVKITMRIRPKAATFLSDRTVAELVMPPFGASTIELRTEGTAPLAREAIIAAEGQESLVTNMTRLTRDFSALREDVSRVLQEMVLSFVNLRKLTEGLANGKGLAGRVLSDERLADELMATLKDARAATQDARKLLAEAEKQVPGAMSDTRAMTQDGQKLVAKLNVAVDELPRVIAATERTLALAEQLTATLLTAAGHAPELARKVDASLDETNRLVTAAQNSVFLGSMPDRPVVRTESAVRPPIVLPDAGAR